VQRAGDRSGFDDLHRCLVYPIGRHDAAARFHHEEGVLVAVFGEGLEQPIDVAPDPGFQVRVDGRGVGPFVLPEPLRERGGAGDGQLGISGLQRLGDDLLMGRIVIRVQQADGHRVVVGCQFAGELREGRLVRFIDCTEPRMDPLVDLVDVLPVDDRVRFLQEEVVDVVSLLPPDDRDVSESIGDDERGLGALPLEDRVRGDGRRVNELRDLGPGDPLPFEELVEPLEDTGGRIVRRRGVLENLRGAGLLVGHHEVREGPPDIERHPFGHRV